MGFSGGSKFTCYIFGNSMTTVSTACLVPAWICLVLQRDTTFWPQNRFQHKYLKLIWWVNAIFKFCTKTVLIMILVSSCLCCTNHNALVLSKVSFSLFCARFPFLYSVLLIAYDAIRICYLLVRIVFLWCTKYELYMLMAVSLGQWQ